ncbi:PKD domain-containing protein, partial [Candidatus Magnetomorum sp. HK-1]
MKYPIRIMQILFIAIISFATFVHAQPQKMAKIASDVPIYSERFSYDVAISGDYALVIAPDSYKILAYKRNAQSWDHIQNITFNSNDTNDKPFSVSMDGEYAVVGRFYYHNGSFYNGAASIYKRNGDVWTLQTTVSPTDQTEMTYFGYDVAIKGDYIVVGAYYKDCAYIYKRNIESWNLIKKLTDPDGVSYDSFGYNVAISNEYIIVGAYNEDNNATNSGSAYIFKNSNDSWTQTAILNPDDPAENNYFGRSVAITDEYAAIGASFADSEVKDSGKAYVFERSGESWSQMTMILPKTNEEYGLFGETIAISGDKVAIGFKARDTFSAVNAGCVNIYKLDGNTCTQISTYYPDIIYDVDHSFGYSLDLYEDYFIAGSLSYSGNPNKKEEAYIGYISTPQLNIEYDNFSNLPIPMSVFSELGGNITLLVESSNQTVIPNSGINLSESGSNSIVIST